MCTVSGHSARFNRRGVCSTHRNRRGACITHRIILIPLLFILHPIFAQPAPRMVINFNSDWKFLLGDDSAAVHQDYNDAQWRHVQLPHDWSIEGPFTKNNPTTTQQAALPAGVGWYRKVFVLPAEAKGNNIDIEFDGIYRNSEVWINGFYLGKRPYGYSSFSYSLTDHVLPAPGRNVIVVKADNSQQPSSRWYTGSGIYRNTRLLITSPLAAVAHWGIGIATQEVSAAGALVVLTTKIKTAIKEGKSLSIHTIIYDATGRAVPGVHDPVVPVFAFSEGMAKHRESLAITKPQLWSVDRPYLYKAVTRISYKGKLMDQCTTFFGVRSFHFDPDKGFFLNGKPMKIRGVCNHHDLGALGAAVNTRAIERQLQLLKAMGCNAIRTAHNQPAPELLDLCDRMGFLVLEEAFDMWRKKKNKYDYYADFDQWYKQDLADMVLRDRNHPSVFMWSIGNEIREQFDSSGIGLARSLADIIKSIDSTRPVTCALSEWNPAKNFIYQSGALDVVGLNYHQEVYEDFHKYYPGKIFLGTENMSAFASRGHYDMPSDSSWFWPAKSPQKIVEQGNPDFTVSAYDQVAAYWGSTHEATWKIIKKHDFLSGLFVWSGFDFLGEPIPYPWPARSAYYGIIDLAGFPKDVYYMYQSEWTSKPVLHVFPHWNWTPGKLVDIWAYYNNADEAELFLNGQSQGTRRKQNDDLHVMWRLKFSPGTIKVVTRRNGKTILTSQIQTAGAAAMIRLDADTRSIRADGNGLCFVTVTICDKHGIPVPDADNLFSCGLTGPAAVAATDNGYQADTSSFQTSEKRCWKGKGLVILRSSGKKGNITLNVFGKGLRPARITVAAGKETNSYAIVPGKTGVSK